MGKTRDGRVSEVPLGRNQRPGAPLRANPGGPTSSQQLETSGCSKQSQKFLDGHSGMADEGAKSAHG